MVLGPKAAVDNRLFVYVFLALVEVQAVLSKSILRTLLSNAAMRRSSNVSMSVDGLRHLTQECFRHLYSTLC